MEWLESKCIDERGDFDKNKNICCISIEEDQCAERFGIQPEFIVKSDEFAHKKRIFISIIFAALYGLVIYLLLGLGTFQSVNVGITVTLALLLIMLGKRIRKSYWIALSIGILIIMIIAVPLAIAFFATGEYIWRDYGYFDITSHFLAGLFIYFFLSAILREKNPWKIFGYAILIEFGYEGIEIFLDVVLQQYAHLEHLHWDFYNMLLDITMHLLAGLLAIIILNHYKKKSSIYMDTPIFD